MPDSELDDFLGKMSATEHESERKERRKRQDEQSRRIRVAWIKRAASVVWVSTGAATGVSVACLDTGIDIDALVSRTLLVFFGGPILGSLLGLRLLVRVQRGEAREKEENWQPSEHDIIIDGSEPWPWMRFVVFAGPIGVAALVFDGRWELVLDSLIGAVIGAFIWKLICDRFAGGKAFN